ncbi:MAG: hypothetical protein EON59_14200 [Alphaproteobacteria bacterium]|nr:MAG: hypothetical protein EON59_14200 [Alphaproteobacteria bacterium]
MVPGEIRVQPARETVRPDEQSAYDRVVGRQTAYGYANGTPGYVQRAAGEEAGPYFGALLRSPRIADHISELGVLYRRRGEEPDSFSHADREWVDIVLGSYLGYNMWGHICDGLAVGVRSEAVLAILEHRDADLEADERRLADIIRRFSDGELDEGEDWAFLNGRFGERGAIEYLAWLGHLTMTIRLIQALIGRHATSDEDAAARVRKLVETREPLPDPRARIPPLRFEMGGESKK